MLYVYRMCLGDFDVEAIGSVGTWLVLTFFVLCTLFNMIIMFNLLISIIGETFGEVTANAQSAAYQEKASLIAECSYLVGQEASEKLCGKDTFLLIATDTDQEIVQSKEAQMRAILLLRKEQHQIKLNLTEHLTVLSAKMDGILQKVERIEEKQNWWIIY